MPEATTYDGKARAAEPPYGASIVIRRGSREARQYLILHRAHPGVAEGDWAWTPPAGARLPGEPIADCAVRELMEETGLALPIDRLSDPAADWAVFFVQVDATAIVTLDDEHDEYRWVNLEEAIRRCRPAAVAAQFIAADAAP